MLVLGLKLKVPSYVYHLDIFVPTNYYEASQQMLLMTASQDTCVKSVPVEVARIWQR